MSRLIREAALAVLAAEGADRHGIDGEQRGEQERDREHFGCAQADIAAQGEGDDSAHRCRSGHHDGEAPVDGARVPGHMPSLGLHPHHSPLPVIGPVGVGGRRGLAEREGEKEQDGDDGHRRHGPNPTAQTPCEDGDGRELHEDGGRDHVFHHSDLDLIRDSHMRDLS